MGRFGHENGPFWMLAGAVLVFVFSSIGAVLVRAVLVCVGRFRPSLGPFWRWAVLVGSHANRQTMHLCTFMYVRTYMYVAVTAVSCLLRNKANNIQSGAEKKWTTMQTVNIIYVKCCSAMVAFMEKIDARDRIQIR